MENAIITVHLPMVYGTERCVRCGASLGWSADFMRSEIFGEELPEEVDSLVGEYFCTECGTRHRLVAFSEVELKMAKEIEENL